MSESSRSPGLATLFGIALLLGTIGVSAWLLSRPEPSPVIGKSLPEGDVFCSGRVDTILPVVALEPAIPGRVVKISVNEGSKVSPGQELLALDNSIAVARLAQAEATVEALQVELDSALRDSDRVPLQLEAREAMLEAAKARVLAAEKLLEVRKKQSESTQTPVSKAETEMLQAQIKEIKELENAEEKNLDDLKKIDPNLRVRAARARLKAAQAERDQATNAVADCILRAPEAGIILRLQTSPGALLSPASPFPAVVFAPMVPLIIRAEVDQEFLNYVKVGAKAVIQDENLSDGPQWQGRVRELGRWVAPRRNFILEPGEINDVRTVEAVIEIDGNKEDALWIGQRMRVRIVRTETPSKPGS